MPARSAKAISERVPNSPPTATTRVGTGDHYRVPGFAEACCDGDVHVTVGRLAVRAGKYAHRLTATRLRSPARRLHDTAEAAADKDRTRTCDLFTHLLGESDLLVGRVSRADHRDVEGAVASAGGSASAASASAGAHRLIGSSAHSQRNVAAASAGAPTAQHASTAQADAFTPCPADSAR